MSFLKHMKEMKELREKEKGKFIVEVKIKEGLIDARELVGYQAKMFLCPSIQDSICLSQDIRESQKFESKEDAEREVWVRIQWMGRIASFHVFKIHAIEDLLK